MNPNSPTSSASDIFDAEAARDKLNDWQLQIEGHKAWLKDQEKETQSRLTMLEQCVRSGDRVRKIMETHTHAQAPPTMQQFDLIEGYRTDFLKSVNRMQDHLVVASTGQSLEDLRRQVSKLSRENENLKSELQHTQEIYQEKEKKVEELTAETQRLERLRDLLMEQQDSLNHTMSQMRARESKLGELEQKWHTMTEEHEQQLAESETQLREQHTATVLQLKAQITSQFSDKESELTDALQSVTDEFEAYKTQSHSEISEMTSQIKEMNESKELLETQLNTLRKRDSQQNDEIHRLQTQFQSAKQKSNVDVSTTEDSSGDSSSGAEEKLALLEEELQTIRDENQKLKFDKANENSLHTALQQQLEMLQREKDIISNKRDEELELLQSQIDGLTITKRELEGKLKKSEESDVESTQLATITQLRSELQHTSDTKNKEITELKEQLSEQQEDLYQQQQDILKYQEQLEQREEASNELHEQFSSVQQQLQMDDSNEDGIVEDSTSMITILDTTTTTTVPTTAPTTTADVVVNESEKAVAKEESVKESLEIRDDSSESGAVNAVLRSLVEMCGRLKPVDDIIWVMMRDDQSAFGSQFFYLDTHSDELKENKSVTNTAEAHHKAQWNRYQSLLDEIGAELDSTAMKSQLQQSSTTATAVAQLLQHKLRFLQHITAFHFDKKKYTPQIMKTAKNRLSLLERELSKRNREMEMHLRVKERMFDEVKQIQQSLDKLKRDYEMVASELDSIRRNRESVDDSFYGSEAEA